jgi:Uma2 family endonuclease
MPLPKREEIYTYEDYLNWPDEQRIELINGQILDDKGCKGAPDLIVEIFLKT